MMQKLLVVLVLVCFLTPVVSANEDSKASDANSKASGRIEAAGTVLDEIQGARINVSRKKFLVRLNVWPWSRPCSMEASSSAAVMAGE